MAGEVEEQGVARLRPLHQPPHRLEDVVARGLPDPGQAARGDGNVDVGQLLVLPSLLTTRTGPLSLFLYLTQADSRRTMPSVKEESSVSRRMSRRWYP